MTDKEALEQRIKILEEENKNLKKDINIMCDKKHPYTWRSLMDERNNLRNLYLEKCFKLDKYKKTFEILKKHLMINLGENEVAYFIETPLLGNCKLLISKEENELLKELMKL